MNGSEATNPAHRTARFRCELPSGSVPLRFAIITAFNPGDVPNADSLNWAADSALAAELDLRGIPRFRVTGGSPDFRHCEPGWGAVLAGLAQAIGIARQFSQAALYWVDDDRLWLVGCGSGELEDLGLWSARTDFGR